MEAKEVFTKGINGYFMLFVTVFIIAVGIYFLPYNPLITILAGIIFVFSVKGFKVINPNEAAVLTLFGKYKGTIVDNGFVWVNPFMIKQTISLRARNNNSDQIKVNDKMGNPILISAVMVWKVKDTYKASFDVDNYINFVDVQSEAAVRNLAVSYCYDSLEMGDNEEITLRSGGEEVNDVLENALKDRLRIAGIEVIEARISNLAYAPEIAGAMLQRQQATAVVAARHKIVEGAVSMVEMALAMLSEKDIVNLDEEKKAAMVSNLLVVLTSDKAASPVLNAGTLNH
ncbi:MAG: SPFH domain-containing protein [Rikenellaceae bacterium]|nr:SPFH domain-containing protein [Rikenellaceae bacterium]